MQAWADYLFAERLRALVNGKEIQSADRARVIDVLTLKASNKRVQFDVVPFLYENIRLARENPKNARPPDTLIAFRMLDHLDWVAFKRDPSRLKFNTPVETLKASLRPAAEAFLNSQYANPAVLHREAASLGIQALLFRFTTSWHRDKKKRDVKRILAELLDFCLSHLGYLPMTELGLVWSGIRTKQIAPFFGPVINPSKKIFDDIRGMAWDMSHLRLMEQTALQSSLGSFFIPHFVSLDERWRKLLHLNPIRLMMIDDSRKSMLFARANELAFQTVCNEVAGAKLLAEQTPAKIEARRRTAQSLDADAMQQLVLQEERAWLQTKPA
ncbi:hypothetical protein [Burkholderia sp. F1]|uniref:hypothetical protein n=1 Tax=Burkholderia sp. F1 TaxID=3366817 RepID=UPI003D715827